MATSRRVRPRRMQVARESGRRALALRPAAGVVDVRPSEAPRVASGLAPRPVYETVKRLLDVSMALVLIVIALPLIALIALLIRLDTPGPAFYTQQRLGKNARPFGMLKFRSMRVNMEAIPEELLQRNESTGPLFKIRRDPRITRVGRWLRRTSLDELPQLFNVLVGEMSLVGPRPPLPRELAGYDQMQRLRLRVSPGLTGLWQVSGRSDLPFDEMVRLDLRYIEERSLLMDVTILARTVPSVLLGRGAY